ncbi:hypothetical protein DJ51_5541 [Bacillus cereus]|nr:hypothetical protein DJ51_5541 [Bacillus cereus]
MFPVIASAPLVVVENRFVMGIFSPHLHIVLVKIRYAYKQSKGTCIIEL